MFNPESFIATLIAEVVASLTGNIFKGVQGDKKRKFIHKAKELINDLNLLVEGGNVLSDQLSLIDPEQAELLNDQKTVLENLFGERKKVISRLKHNLSTISSVLDIYIPGVALSLRNKFEDQVSGDRTRHWLPINDKQRPIRLPARQPAWAFPSDPKQWTLRQGNYSFDLLSPKDLRELNSNFRVLLNSYSLELEKLQTFLRENYEPHDLI